MKLAELKLVEAAEQAPAGPIELKDLIKYFPGNYAKAIQKMWGKDRLVYNGMKFFDDGKLGEAYDKATDAVEATMKESDFTAPVSLHLPDGDALGMTEFEYDAHIESSQEVYLGYSSEHDQLFLGVDAWLDENDFNEEWDRKFKADTGVSYNEDEEDHSALFHDAWKKYTNMGGYGILFELSKDLHHAEPVIFSQGGFYRGVCKDPQFKRFQLVDVRLD